MTAKVLTKQINAMYFWILLVFCVGAIAVYVFSINATVHQVARREAIEKELAERISKIGNLEFQYVERKNNIDLTMAKELGFEELATSKFVSRSAFVARAGDVSSRQ